MALEWRSYMGNFLVSNRGDFVSVSDPYHNRYTPLPISKRINRKTGYEQVSLTLDGHTYTRNVHRVVAILFLGEPPTNEHCVNHKDGVKHNNDVANLEWSTPRENTHHALRMGLKKRFVWPPKNPKGENSTNAKLTDAQAAEIKALLASGTMRQRDIAKIYGVSQGTVSNINVGLSWV